MSTDDVVKAAIGGIVGIKVLETGMKIIDNKKPRKIKKLKKIKSSKWL